MERLVDTSKDKGLGILADLRNYRLDPPFSIEKGSSLLIKLASEISHEMLGCILRLSYANMLKEAQTRHQGSKSSEPGQPERQDGTQEPGQ